jgi:hypothetical protein
MAFFFAAPKYFSLLTVLRIGVGLDIISAQWPAVWKAWALAVKALVHRLLSRYVCECTSAILALCFSVYVEALWRPYHLQEYLALV